MRAIFVTLLLLASALGTGTASAQATSAERELNKSDPAGDPSLRGNFVPGLTNAPSNPVTDPLDLVNLRVHDEDLEGVHIELKTKDLQRPPGHFGALRYSVQFRLEGTSAFYHLEWTSTSYGFVPGEESPFLLRLCIKPSEQTYQCNRQRVVGGADHKENRLFAYVPKLSLMGLDPLQGGSALAQPIRITAGSILGNFFARSGGDQSFLEDRLPDSAYVGPFILQEPAANERIRLTLTALNETEKNENPYTPYQPYGSGYGVGDFARVAVEPGNTSLVKLDVTNINSAKRIINLTASVLDPKAAAKWDLRIAPSVQVPGNESRVVNLIVTARDKVEHREETLIRVVAKSLGIQDEVGAITMRLVASVPPSVPKPTLYFHAAKIEYHNLPGVADVECTVAFFTCDYQRWINTLENDPTGTADAEALKGRAFFFNPQGGFVEHRFALDTDLSRDLVLDTKQPVKGILKVVPVSGAASSVELTIRAGKVQVGSVAATVPSGSAPVDVPITFLPMVEAGRIPAGSQLDINVRLVYPTQGLATPPAFVPKGSSITLPIIPDPRAKVNAAALGDAFLGLSVRGDDEEFVNPGRTKAFKLLLVNEGDLKDTVDLNVTVLKGECSPHFQPADRFELGPGDSVRFGLLVFVPDSVKEGDQCVSEVTAVSSVDSKLRVGLQLTTIATRGVDIPDDSGNFTADEDARSKGRLRNGPNGTPGLGAVGMLMALGAAVALGMRRRLQP